MRETFPDRVVYILGVPRATSQDSGTYECSITHVMSGAVRASGVAITIFGEKHLARQASASSILNNVIITAVKAGRFHMRTRCFKCVEIISGC